MRELKAAGKNAWAAGQTEERMKDYKKEIEQLLDQVGEQKPDPVAEILERINGSKYVCVFGLGTISHPIVAAIRNFTTLQIDFVCDNDPAKWGNYYHQNLKCLSPDELAGFGNDVAVLIATQSYREIHEQLKKRGLNNIHVMTEYRLLNQAYLQRPENLEVIRRNAVRMLDLLSDEQSRRILLVLISNWFRFSIEGAGYRGIFSRDQYYPSGIIQLRPDEVFVDAGAYNGDTLLEFVDRSGKEFKSIFAFELDRNNFTDLERACGQLDPALRNKIALYNCGLWDEQTEISYKSGEAGSESSCMNVIGSPGESGRAVRLSDITGDAEVSFIKMDIEGSELKALLGAEEVIRNQKPKLAVCVYHRPEHLWEIPSYLKSLVPEYRIFLRHHTNLEYETVCYAVP
jgi:FkbM family methyltransferase